MLLGVEVQEFIFYPDNRCKINSIPTDKFCSNSTAEVHTTEQAAHMT